MRQFLPLLLGFFICLLVAAVAVRLMRRTRRHRYTSDRRQWWAG